MKKLSYELLEMKTLCNKEIEDYKVLLANKNKEISDINEPTRQGILYKKLFELNNKDIKSRLRLLSLFHNWAEFSRCCLDNQIS